MDPSLLYYKGTKKERPKLLDPSTILTCKIVFILILIQQKAPASLPEKYHHVEMYQSKLQKTD